MTPLVLVVVIVASTSAVPACPKPHERYSKCLLAECQARTCSQLGYPIACPSVSEPCEGGCICEYGYVMDTNGDCIENSKCPTCGDDPNAVSGCGNPCGKTCESLYANTTDIVCPQYCEFNGCDCKPGYRLPDDGSKKCVPEQECPKPKPPQCNGQHQRYIDCVDGQCGPKTCQDLKTPPPCPRVIPPCPGGCICEEGYLRNSERICTKREQCPIPECPTNEEWAWCRTPSVWERCEDRYNSPPFLPDDPNDCTPRCACKEGFWRNQANECVSPNECPAVTK